MIRRIAVIAGSRYPIRAPFAGGMESITWHLVEGMRRRGVPITLFAAPGSDPQLEAETIEVEPLVLSDAARADVAMPPEKTLREHHAYLQVMLELGRRDLDVVHNNSLHYLPIVMAELLTAPMVTTLHTPPTPWLEPAARIANAADIRYAAVSAATAEQWSGIVEATVIPNGVDLDQWAYGDGGDSLVWTGRIVPEKAPHLAIAIAEATGRRLRIAGPRPDPGYWGTFIKPHLGDLVTYEGHLAGHQLAELIGASAAALVTPVWDEPYGLVAAEALACGTPVLAIARGGLPEVVGHDCGRLIEPGTEEAMIAAGASLLSETMALPRAAARRHAVEHCSLNVMIDRYLALYEELSTRRRSA